MSQRHSIKFGTPAIYKLHQLQVPDRLVFIIQQYLTNRHFSFRHEKHFCQRLITAGVPQGSTLSRCFTPRTRTTFRARKQASNSRSSPTTPPYT
ncbi:hypothetical protein EVAR_3142_1 [Eumeta japonica]|uniref:Uncharacterized protein n=1 Tax=Eumeta variegata TaxID=151549 RepID=A0A4C1XH63_EUMVA|nr:hypothetical protein EVAR_3142_1 [Eumeta japonica]